MLVHERMTRSPATVTDQATVEQALAVIERHGLHSLCVVDSQGSLVGLLLDKDLFRAGGEELVQAIMSRKVISVSEYATIEEAVQLMADHNVPSLPVTRRGKLVGLLSTSDLFRIVLELLAADEKGLRLTMLVPEEKGMLASVTSEIARMGGNILALSTFAGEDPTNRMVTIKVADVSRGRLVAIMEALGMEIVDAREV